MDAVFHDAEPPKVNLVLKGNPQKIRDRKPSLGVISPTCPQSASLFKNHGMLSQQSLDDRVILLLAAGVLDD